jgi:hypothetical protein
MKTTMKTTMTTATSAPTYEAALASAKAAGMTHRLDFAGRVRSIRRLSVAKDMNPEDILTRVTFSVPFRDGRGDHRTVSFVTVRDGTGPREGLVTGAQLEAFFTGLESVRA